MKRSTRAGMGETSMEMHGVLVCGAGTVVSVSATRPTTGARRSRRRAREGARRPRPTRGGGATPRTRASVSAKSMMVVMLVDGRSL